MMAKMGWAEGKGLGAQEDGTTDYVKVQKRLDNRGVGADVNTSNNWLSNTSAFDDILSKLNARSKPLPPPSSDTPKNTIVNRRIRFHKLVKAKTLSNHNSKDISAILAPQQDSDSSDDEFEGGDLRPTFKRRKVELPNATTDSKPSTSSNSESESESSGDDSGSSSSSSDSESSSDSSSSSDSGSSSSSDDSSSSSDSDSNSDSDSDSDSASGSSSDSGSGSGSSSDSSSSSDSDSSSDESSSSSGSDSSDSD